MRLVLIYIGLVLCLSLTAQQDSLLGVELENIETTTYQELVDEVRYEKNKSKLLPRKFEERKREKKKEKKTDTKSFDFLNGSLVKLLVYGVIAIFVLIILWLLLSNIKLDKNDNDLTELALADDDIENIEEVDADAGYHAAVKEGNYRLACRMVFLKVLQKLEQTEKIRWKKEKTNRNYLSEMAGDELGPTFRSLVQRYELVWYGDRYIDVTGLDKYTEEASKIVPINSPAHD